MTVKADGSVEGAFKYVTGYTGFNEANPTEQEGYFFPFSIKTTGSTMTFKKNGSPTKEGIPFEKDNVFRVTQTDTFTVLVDDDEVVTFSFANATFPEKATLSLDDLTKAELLDMASEKGIDGITTKMTKTQIIEKIEKA